MSKTPAPKKEVDLTRVKSPESHPFEPHQRLTIFIEVLAASKGR
jgi:hypothetical protein